MGTPATRSLHVLPPPMASLLLLLLLLLLLSSASGDLSSDRAALLAFRAAVGGRLQWNSTSSTPCSWPGVACQSNRVTILRLPGSGLTGAIPPSTISNLTALRTLSLRFNALSGPLPSDLPSAAELRNVYLQGNRFSGDFPPPLLSLPRLVRLNLANNNLSGRIPPRVSNLTRLRTLLLDGNGFSGEIPDLGLPNLVQFNVSYNKLNGSVPPSLRAMPGNSFLGMSLCGLPLAACPGEISPAPAPGAIIPGGGASKSKKSLSGGAIAGIAIGSVAAAIIVLGLLILLCRKSRSKTAVQTNAVAKPADAEAGRRDKRITAATAASSTGAMAGAKAAKKLVFFGEGQEVFDLEDLLRASAEVLGKGTFGTAYKAVLEAGIVVVVKRLKDVNLPEKEFREKIEDVGAMAHPNLVALKAYYFSKDEKLLVYDYMSMGSLSALLHGNRGAGRTPLDWETRSKIALAAARGIEYIHSTGPAASHGNIKSSNVLLAKKSSDAHMSDHGLAHLIGSTAAPTRVAGYRAPEVTDLRKVSQKADVYSFGVLLLELLTGKAPQQPLLNEEGVDLPRWVQSVVREEWTSEVFDAELLGYQNAEEKMVQLLQLAIDCTAMYPDKRPSMAEVVARIEEIRGSSEPAVEQGQQHHHQPHNIEEAEGLSRPFDADS